MQTQSCPSPTLLQHYASGELADDIADFLYAHLESCPQCLAQMEQLSGQSLLKELRNTPVPDAAEVAFLRQLTARLQPDVASAPPLQPGDHVQDYRIIELLAVGGMGEVYRVEHVLLGKRFALKMVHPKRVADPHVVARFAREMKAIGQLHHPNIVQATDAGECEGRPYLVMELLDGIDLSRWVKNHGPMALTDAIPILCQTVAALDFAHRNGLIHRDVKPSNIMVTPTGEVKLLDLGLALFHGERETPATDAPPTHVQASDRTATNVILGTPDYMAPEQRTNPRGIGPAGDIYSLGATLWYLLTGNPPPTKPLLMKPLPGHLDEATWRLFLDADPQRRFACVYDVLRHFTPTAQHTPTRRGLWLSLAFAVVAMGISIAVMWPGTKSPTSEPAPGQLPFDAKEAVALQERWATYRGQPTTHANAHGLRFALIPPGAVGLSSSCRTRISKPYYLATMEVTRGQYRQFVQATQHRTHAERDPQGGELLKLIRNPKEMFQRGPHLTWQTPGFTEISDDHPVTQLAWEDAVAYCDWLSQQDGRRYRLPTEAEWLWAARCGDQSESIEDTLKKRVGEEPNEWYIATTRPKIQPRAVGLLPPNPWGLHDMLGNVMELCLDEYDELPAGDHIDYRKRGGTVHQYHVVRGHAYFSALLSFDHSRVSLQEYGTGHVGFRVLLEVD